MARARTEDAATGGSDRPALSVSELNRAARRLLEEGFPEAWVEGEISGFRAYPSGHWYFQLKDESASVSAVMFRGANVRCRVRPEDGLHVVVRGRVSLYEARGTFQVIVEHLEPAGLGALHAAFERLKAKLAAEGLFDPDLKRPLPMLPRRIGVATSTAGAALRDILKVLQSRGARVEVVISPCRVQGDGAAEEIVRALQRLEVRGGLDAVIVGRGGGSLEDLWAFNEEVVARAIRAMSVPVISAVGHEIDTTIADLAADVRAATPSQAAELVAAPAEALQEIVRVALARLRQAARASTADARVRLARVEPRRVGQRLEARAQRLAQHLDHLAARLARQARADVARRRVELHGLSARLSPRALAGRLGTRHEGLDSRLARLTSATRRLIQQRGDVVRTLGRALYALSPQAVLDRGYAVLLTPSRQVVRRARDARAGEALTARLAEGSLDVTVTRVVDAERRNQGE